MILERARLETNRVDVHRGGDHLRRVLVALSRVLHLRIPQSFHQNEALHPTTLSGLLLARHGQRHVQPYDLLLDESQVSSKTDLQCNSIRGSLVAFWRGTAS